MIVHTILYVAEQRRSTDFYKHLLGMDPILDVPGMTEFQLTESHILGLMPESGIKHLLGDQFPDPCRGNGIPRVELYIRVANPESYFARAKEKAAIEVSPIIERNWGERAGYLLDPDGHVIAFSS